MEIIDTHCHLSFEPLVGDIEAVLRRARKAGVSQIVVPAYDAASWQVISGLSTRPGVYAAYGLHPWCLARSIHQSSTAAGDAQDSAVFSRLAVLDGVSTSPPRPSDRKPRCAPHLADLATNTGECFGLEEFDLSEFENRLRGPRTVAVGEIGLDFKIDLGPGDREGQIDLLRRQVEIAVALDLPVILHCRGAFEEMVEVLKPFVPRLRGVVHAYSRGPELATRFINLGLHIAFGGAVTRPNARRAHRSAVMVTADRLLLETDAPSIGLAGVPAEEAEPRHALDVARSLAPLRGERVEDLAAQTTANARELFRFGD